jgi:branched-subunit amino acid transport protein
MAYQWQENANNLPGSAILLVNAILGCINIVQYAFLGLILSTYETGLGPYFAVSCLGLSIVAFFYFYIWHLAKRKKSYISYIVGTGVCGLGILGALPVLVSLTFYLPTFFGACIGFVVGCVLFAILLKNVISEKMFKQATRPTVAEIVSIVMGGVIALCSLISLMSLIL